MKQRILLYGGTFDPPHNGHMNLLRAAVKELHPAQVFIEPAGLPPHKAASATAPEHRLAMCRCFLSVAQHVTVDDTEIRRAGKSYTVDTLRTFCARFPEAEIYLALGSDMLLSFQTWKDYREILRMATLVVQSRKDGDSAELMHMAQVLQSEGAQVILVDAPPIELSSAQLRERLYGGQDVSRYLPGEVQSYIAAHGLYQKEKRLCMISLKDARELAQRTLSKKRFQHTLNVEKMAVKLAEKNGVDPQKAALAALLHDIAKEMPSESLLQILKGNDIISNYAASRASVIWHGGAAAVLAQRDYGVDDAEILSAIANHTAGKPGMTKLDKIIYMADMVSEERSYPQVAFLRQKVMENLDDGYFCGLGMSIEWLLQCNRPVDEQSLLAYKDMKKQLYGGICHEPESASKY